MTIVSLSVRYKSATVEEFIEKHAADVSGHGIFVKTDREFALGTLLQLDVRIADKQTLIAGVGRVVWRREATAGTLEKPVGVGVQFLRIDKSSRAMIDRLVAAKPDAGKRYQAETEMAGPPPEAPPSLPEPATNPRPAGATSPTGVRPRPGWHKTTLVGVGHAAVSPLGTPAPPPAAPSLPLPVPPPRRPTGHHSVIPAPPATHPSKLLVDSFHEKEDLTLIGDLPEMPEERKTTLVGVGGAPLLAPRLPPPVAPPRLGGLLRKPTPAPVATPAPAPVAPVATESAPLVHESDIEVASLLAADAVDDEPEEETRMQSVDDLLGPAISIPSAVATAPMLPEDPSPMIPIETILPAPVETSPMFPVDSEPRPRFEPAPPPAPPPPRVPLPLVLPPRELFVPPLPPSATQGALMAPTGPQAGVLTRAGLSTSGRDKAIAAVGAALFVCALIAFVAVHPWTSADAVDTSAPKATAAASAAPHSPTQWTATRPTAATATAAAPSEVTAPSASAVPMQAPAAPPPPAPLPQPAPLALAPVAQAPAPQAPAPQAAQPPPAAATPPVAAPAPASPSPPPRARVASTPAPSPSPPPATPSPAPAPVATAAPPRAAAPRPAATQAHPTKPSVDDGF
jgi:uncharacterized protein (TIGR02266 family)